MTQERRNRFEIRKQELSAFSRRYGENSPSYVVWDNERGRRVPFGRYRSLELANKRLAQEEDKEVQDGKEKE